MLLQLSCTVNHWGNLLEMQDLDLALDLLNQKLHFSKFQVKVMVLFQGPHFSSKG